MKILSNLTADSAAGPKLDKSHLRQGVRLGVHIENARGHWINLMLKDEGLEYYTNGETALIPIEELHNLIKTHAPAIFTPPLSRQSQAKADAKATTKPK
jgi:hypothetical protein